MPAQHSLRRTQPLVVAATLLILLCGGRPAHAFDTGPHFDVTRAAFQDEGFSSGSPAIGIAQFSNWLVDYYSTRPTTFDAELARMASDLAHLHFDSLVSVAQIRNTWSRLALNTQRAVQSAARDVVAAPSAAERQRRLIHLAMLIGASLHPVQDFYSHSNWVEIYPMQGAVYGTRTWFDTPSPSASLHTGLVGHGNDLHPAGDPRRDHGDYDTGMNHDSYDRPGWSQAYVYAYSASRQWLAAIRQWVEQTDPAVWRDLVAIKLSANDSERLAGDLASAYELSLWVNLQGKNGGWKGRGSGSGTSFSAAVREWMASGEDVFLQRFRGAAGYRPLVIDMDKKDTDPGSPPVIPTVTLGRRAVEVRTLRAAMTGGSPDSPSFTDAAGLFAVVIIAGQSYTEATQQGSNDIRPSWLSIGFVPETAGTASVRYQLFDEDGGLAGANDPIDVNPARGRVAAEFQLDLRTHALSGSLTGVHDTEQRAATLVGGGDADSAVVTLYVTEHALQTSQVTAAPPPGDPSAPPADESKLAVARP